MTGLIIILTLCSLSRARSLTNISKCNIIFTTRCMSTESVILSALSIDIHADFKTIAHFGSHSSWHLEDWKLGVSF